MVYSEKFRSEMVGRMLGPQGLSANALSKSAGVHQPMLSRSLKAARFGAVSKKSRRSSGDRGPSPVTYNGGLRGSSFFALHRRSSKSRYDGRVATKHDAHIWLCRPM